ncbi:MAG TPA: enoyl-CoA hydratase [Kofleriaceae bacterium]|nr:enoyl-CoA hydratase [Kofleriaceae bacterium]
MTTTDLQVVDEAGVRWIALDRPESKNGLTDEVNGRIIDAVDRAADDRAVRCLVLTGKGGNFCSGLDLKAAAQRAGGFDNAEEHMRKYFHGMIRSIRKVEKPVIALVDGAAVGYGCDLALACDIRLGTERTRFGEVFVKRGLMPDGGGTFTLSRLVGVGKALDMMFTGDMVPSDEALRIGLVSRVIPSAEAEATTWTFAKKIAAGPPLVHAWIKRAVYGALDGTLDDALETEVKGQMQLLRSKDFFEGVAAFFQKRDPNFTGE